jgi:hypothetical protein
MIVAWKGISMQERKSSRIARLPAKLWSGQPAIALNDVAATTSADTIRPVNR